MSLTKRNWIAYHRKVGRRCGRYAADHFRAMLRARSIDSREHHERCALSWSALAFANARQIAKAKP